MISLWYSALSLSALSPSPSLSLPNQFLPVHNVPNIQEYFKVPFFSSSCTLSAHTLHNIVLQHWVIDIPPLSLKAHWRGMKQIGHGSDSSCPWFWDACDDGSSRSLLEMDAMLSNLATDSMVLLSRRVGGKYIASVSMIGLKTGILHVAQVGCTDRFTLPLPLQLEHIYMLLTFMLISSSSFAIDGFNKYDDIMILLDVSCKISYRLWAQIFRRRKKKTMGTISAYRYVY